jgi:hypothetical protein
MAQFRTTHDLWSGHLVGVAIVHVPWRCGRDRIDRWSP